MKNTLVIIMHAVIIAAAYSSPIWLDWRRLALGVGLYYLQLLIFGWCVLSLQQFDGERKTFHEWYLAKLGIHPNPKRLRIILNFVIPLLLIVGAIIVQQICKQQVLMRL